jgi:hypothetical protein
MRTPPLAQRGLAALAFVLVLLFTMSLALLWTARSLVFEHRAAANQQRQAIAFAAAESGLGWARARLNDPRAIDARCLPTVAGASFRDQHAAPWVAAPSMQAVVSSTAGTRASAKAGYAPPIGRRAICRIDAEETDCDCPASPPVAIMPVRHGDGPSFAVELVPVAGEARALWLIARGCSGAWESCAAPTSAITEAQAVVRVKLRQVGTTASPTAAVGITDAADQLRSGPLAVVPGSWRDGHCTAQEEHAPCGFEP